MALDIFALLQKKRQSILELWINNQLANDALRDDLISSEEARMQSEELLDAFLSKVRLEARGESAEGDQDPALEMLETIAITRARKGYSPRETGVFLFSFKEALLKTLNDEIKNDPATLYQESLKISNKIDTLTIASSEP